jgi:hypothetical protein
VVVLLLFGLVADEGMYWKGFVGELTGSREREKEWVQRLGGLKKIRR